MTLDIEKRLTAQGPRTRKSYTATLPIEWVKGQKLTTSKKIFMKVVGPKIIISASADARSECSIDADIYGDALIKVLQGMYRAGVQEIHVSYASSKLVSTINAILESALIGYEVVEQKKGYLLIKDIVHGDNEEFKVVLRRIFLLLLGMTEDPDASSRVITHKNSKRLINYCQRMLIMKGHDDYMRVPFYYVLLDRLEKVGDEFLWAYEALDEVKKKPTQVPELIAAFRKAYELLYVFHPREYATWCQKSYGLKNIFQHDNYSHVDMHLHNVARIINSLYGDIFILEYTFHADKK